MPTIREIAEACGVTKQTVTARLKELDLWETHVSKSGNAFVVDDRAASAVADALKTVRRATEDAHTPKSDDSGSDALAVALEALKSALMASQEQNAVLSRELDAKNGQIRELQAQLATSQATIDRLSSRSLFERIFKRSLPPAS